MIFKKLFTIPCLLIFGIAFNAVSFTKDSFHVPAIKPGQITSWTSLLQHDVNFIHIIHEAEK